MGQGINLFVLLVFVFNINACKGQNIFQRIGDFFRGNDESPPPALQLPPSAFAPKPAEGATAYQQLIFSQPNAVGAFIPRYPVGTSMMLKKTAVQRN